MNTPAEDYTKQTGLHAWLISRSTDATIQYIPPQPTTQYATWLEAERTKWKAEAEKHKANAIYFASLMNEYSKAEHGLPHAVCVKYLEENKE